MGENGTNILIKLNSTVIPGKLDSSLLFNTDDIELSSASNTYESVYSGGRIQREASGEFNLELAGTNGWSDLWDAHNDADLLPFIYGGTDTGDLIYAGYLYIRDLEDDDPDNDRSTVTLSLRVTGDLTKTEYTGSIPYIIPFIIS